MGVFAQPSVLGAELQYMHHAEYGRVMLPLDIDPKEYRLVSWDVFTSMVIVKKQVRYGIHELPMDGGTGNENVGGIHNGTAVTKLKSCHHA